MGASVRPRLYVIVLLLTACYVYQWGGLYQ